MDVPVEPVGRRHELRSAFRALWFAPAIGYSAPAIR